MTKEPKPTEIIIEGIPKNRDFPLPSLRLAPLYQTARKIAPIIFAKYPCKFAETEEGLLGTYPDGKQVLLTTDSIMQLVLFSLTDQMVQELRITLGEQVKKHDERVRGSAKYKAESESRKEEAARNDREVETRQRVNELYSNISNIKTELKRIPHSIDANERQINLVRQQGGDTPGQLNPYAQQQIQRFHDNITALREKYSQLENELQVEESKLESAQAALQKISA